MRYLVGALLVVAGVLALVNSGRLHAAWLRSEVERDGPVLWRASRVEFITEMGRGYIAFAAAFMGALGVLLLLSGLWAP